MSYVVSNYYLLALKVDDGLQKSSVLAVVLSIIRFVLKFNATKWVVCFKFDFFLKFLILRYKVLLRGMARVFDFS